MSTERSAFAFYLQKYRVWIARLCWVILLVYVFYYRRIPIQEFDSAIGISGLVVIAFGLLVRSLAAGNLQKNDVLATTGLYAMTRNPLYFGSLLVLLGINVLIWDLLTLGVSVALIALTYVPTIRNEERFLAGRYGEAWQQFVATTPRIFPNLLRIGALRDVRWNLKRWFHNHELSTVLASLAILWALDWYARNWALQ